MRSQRELASMIEQRRREYDLTQAELAQRVGVSRQWIIAVEAAEGNPSFTNLVALLDALDLRLEISELTPTDKPVTVHPDLDELINRHRGPVPEQGIR